MSEHSPFILVHGANLGGWCWQRVKDLMELQGATVYTPTLSGLGEDKNSDALPSLKTYISDITELIEAKDLQNCILVGHSYGGMVITGVADRLADRMQRMIYVDAAVPSDGDDFASHVPDISEENANKRREAFRSLSADGVWIQPMDPQLAGVTNIDDINWVKQESRPHPLSTWLEPLIFENNGLSHIPKTYILSTNPPTDIMGYPIHGAIAKDSRDWKYREIHCGHASMIIEPDKLAKLLLEEID